MKKSVDEFFMDTILASPKIKKSVGDDGEYKADPENPIDSLSVCLIQTKQSLDGFVNIIDE